MKENTAMIHPSLNRRNFLRAAGIGLGLPLFESLLPRAIANTSAAPRRMVCICRGLGLHGPDFFPEQTGRDYALSPYLKEFAPFRSDFTVVSGLSHPNAGGGHAAEVSWLTGAPHAGSPAFKNSVSVDQLAAEHVGNATRFPFLALATHNSGLSVTRNGVQVPPEKDPAALFRKLFISGTPQEVREQEHRLRHGRSILDSVRGELSALEGSLTAPDRDRLDQYTTAVRDVEKRLHNSEAWMKKPKPAVAAEPPGAFPPTEDIVGRSVMMYDLMHLALQTDSTRLVTMLMDQAGGNGVPPIEGVSEGRHGLSHHGLDPAKIAQLRRIEVAELKAFATFLEKLKATNESAGGSLLDHTMVLYGSNMGNASSHDTRNLPILLAGGGFKHGQHLAFDQQRNVPLANLFASMLQRFGVETDRFSTGTGTLTGLDFA
jgi:hypothetical protein